MPEWEAVESVYSKKGWKAKRVLDVGSNIGYYPLRLRELGAVLCVGVEQNDLNREIAHKLTHHIAGGTHIVYHKELAEALGRWSFVKFDVTLMLNVVHWLVKQGGLGHAEGCIRDVAVQADQLLVAYPLRAADSMAKIDMHKDVHDMVDWLQEITGKKCKSFSGYTFYGCTRYLCLLR